jgi:FixJ family two-component response regulator
MPGMVGPSVARRFSETRPDTRVAFAFGYTKERIAQPPTLDGKAEILAKPFTNEELPSRARMAR